MPFNENAGRCNLNTSGIILTSTGRSLTRSSRCWLPLGSTGRRFGNTYLLPSIDRILSWKGDTQERTMKKSNKNGRLPSCTFWITRFVPVPSVLTWQWLFAASILTTWLRRMQLMGPKLFMHVAGRPRMVPTVSRGMPSLT